MSENRNNFVYLVNHDFFEDVKACLLSNENINTNILEWTFLHFVNKNNIDMVKFFISHNCVKSDLKKNRPIEIATRLGHVDILKLLLKDPIVDPTVQFQKPFLNAINQGCIESVKILLEDPRINPTQSFNLAIKKAIKSNNKEIICLLWKIQDVKDLLKKEDFVIYTELLKLEVEKKINNFN